MTEKDADPVDAAVPGSTDGDAVDPAAPPKRSLRHRILSAVLTYGVVALALYYLIAQMTGQDTCSRRSRSSPGRWWRSRSCSAWSTSRRTGLPSW